MGTITRTFANNITTSGVFKPTAFNNASFDSVTAVPSGSLPAGGNMVLLSTQTASGSASISFTSGIDSTYKEYMFIFNNIHPSNDGRIFQFNLSTDGGSNYNVTKTSTGYYSRHDEPSIDPTFEYRPDLDLAQSTAYQDIGNQVGADADECCSGILHLYNPSNTTYVKHFINRSAIYMLSDKIIDQYNAGYANTTSAINAINFKFDIGNIDDGTIQMFGIL